MALPIIALRLPSTSAASSAATTSTSTSSSQPPPPPPPPPPPLSFMLTTWHVTHSTLPMWRKARNVRITYSALAAPTTTTASSKGKEEEQKEETSPKLDDLVTYQSLTSDKVKRVEGIDTPSSGVGSASAAAAKGWSYDWRGKGWLMIASSHWEVLGYGDDDADKSEGGGGQYVVTYFAKTLFTPAGIDIYSKSDKGLSGGTVEAIKKALGELPNQGIKALAEELFEVKLDPAANY